MKNTMKIVTVVNEAYRQNALKVLTKKVGADIVSVQDEVKPGGEKSVAIYAVVKKKKFFKNHNRVLQYGDVAIMN